MYQLPLLCNNHLSKYAINIPVILHIAINGTGKASNTVVLLRYIHIIYPHVSPQNNGTGKNSNTVVLLLNIQIIYPHV